MAKNTESAPHVDFQEFETYPTGVYVATITAITYDTTGKFGPQFKFEFALGGEYEGKYIRSWASEKLSPKSKLFKWALPFVSEAYLREHGFDVELMLNRKCWITVVEEEVEGEVGRMVNRILSVKPFSAADAGVKAPSAGVVQEEIPF